MSITKTDHQLETVKFVFQPAALPDGSPNPQAGAVQDILMDVNYALVEDGKQLVRVRETISILAKLPPGVSVAAANSFGKRCRALTSQV